LFDGRRAVLRAVRLPAQTGRAQRLKMLPRDAEGTPIRHRDGWRL